MTNTSFNKTNIDIDTKLNTIFIFIHKSDRKNNIQR